MVAIQDPKMTHRDFKSFQRLIYDLAGIALADTKEVMVQSRLAKRLRILELDSYADYWNLLSSGNSPDEITNFINALTTNKTDFFRENHHFDFLTKTFFPEIVRRAQDSGQKKLRIWCSASSTGEEPYSIAMTIREFFGEDPNWDIRILASDIDTEVLETASKGVYTADRFSDVTISLQKKYFYRESKDPQLKFQAKPTLRDLLTFRRINLQEKDWPINAVFDVIFCRNVMIYFNTQTQAKLVEHFSEKLSPDGYLIIGHSESLNGLTDRFKPLGETVYGHTYSPNNLLKKRGGNQITTEPVPVFQQAPKSSAAKVANSKPVTVLKAPTARTLPRSSSDRDLAAGTNSVRQTNPTLDEVKHPIIVGEVHASGEPMWVTTTLGSCVAVCLYDDLAGVGGMNHFMLPESSSSSRANASYGIHAMELLINRILNQGGDRRRLKAKVFGGGTVIATGRTGRSIGQKNVEFAEQFLETEGIPIIARHTGGDTGMRVEFNTRTAKVFVRCLDREATVNVDRDDFRFVKAATEKAQPADITLF